MVSLMLYYQSSLLTTFSSVNEEEAQQQRKKARFEYQPLKNAAVPPVKHTKAQHAFFTKLTFSERKAALNLAQLAHDEAPGSNPENCTGQDDTENLIKALIVSSSDLY